MDFRRWALTDLALNINRGRFAEWLVGKALGVVAPDNYQMGWASYDLDYEDRKIEVKSSARGQSWHQNRPSAVSWGIAPSRSQWDHSMEGGSDAPRSAAESGRCLLGLPLPLVSVMNQEVCVYGMRMARVNVYLPDELAERARAADLNVSGLTQEAIRRALDARAVNDWLDDLASLEPVGIDPETVREAVSSAKDDFGL